jgi:predicted RND superfamily exporter protein
MSVRTLLRLLVVAVLLAGVGLGLARVRTDTTASSFLPGDDATQVATTAAARSFGGDPIVVVAESAEDGALLGGDEILKLVGLEGTLAALPDVSVVYGPGTVLNQVATQARNLLATISGRRDALQELARQRALAKGATKAVAERAAEAAVRPYDERYGRLLVQGLPAGLPTLRNPGFVKAVVLDADGTPRQQWRFVVPRADAVAVVVRPREGLDQAATERLVDAVTTAVDDADLATERVTVTGMPVVAAGLADVLKREMPVIGGVALALTTLCYLLLPWLRRSPRRVLPVLTTALATAATLAVFGWLDHPVSLGVVAFLPILLGTGSDFPAYLVRGAERRTVVVTGLAAAAGFATLVLSPVPLVKDLGIALAVGVVLTLALGLVVAGRSDLPDAEPEPEGGSRPRPALGRLPRLALLGGALVLATVGWTVLPGLDIEADPEQLIAGAPGTAAIDHAEDVLGSSGEVQLLVRGDDVMTPETLAWMTEVEALVVRRYGDRLHPIVSPPSLLAFLGDEPTAEQLEAGLAQVPGYLRSAVVRADRRQAVLSFGIELDDVAAQRRLLEDIVRDAPAPPDGVTLDTAGLPVVAGRSYALMSEHRYLHAGVGILAAGLALVIGLRRRREALLAVGAAVLATGWGFLAAQLLGIALTPLTLALGSLATATACEFTVLLGAAQHRRVLVRSVLVAATAATSGYLALAASDLAVIRGFGLFLAATVGLSLLASYVVRLALPATAPTRPTSVPGAAPAQPRVEVLV